MLLILVTLAGSALAAPNSVVDGDDKSTLPKRWWVKNARSYPLQPDWNTHLELRYGYSKMGGNLDGDSHEGELDLTLRRQYWTSLTRYDLRKSNATRKLNNLELATETQDFLQRLSYDLTPHFSAAAGLKWERNDIKYIDSRLSYFGGIKWAPLTGPNFNLDFGLNYGRENTEFDVSGIQGIKAYSNFPPVDDLKTDGVFLMQSLKWQITTELTFTQGFNFMQYIKESDYYHWSGQARLNFKLTETLSVYASYRIAYEQSPLVDAVDSYLKTPAEQGGPAQDTGGEIENLDDRIMTGIQLTF